MQQDEEEEEEDEEEEEEEEEEAPLWRWHDVLQDPPEHPRREYGRLRHVCQNARALSDWNGGSGGGGANGGIGGSGGGSTGGGSNSRSASTPSGGRPPAAPGGGGPSPSSGSSPAGAAGAAGPASLFSSSPAERAGTPASLAGSAADEGAGRRGGPLQQVHVVQRFHGHDRGAVIALHVDEARDRCVRACAFCCMYKSKLPNSDTYFFPKSSVRVWQFTLKALA